MARTIWTILIAGAAVLFFAQNAFAFRCDGGIISRGDFIDIVIAKCGEPTTSRVVKEELTGSFGHTSTDQGLGRVIRQGTVTKTVEQTEVLMYNCGGYRLIHLLTFRGGRLKRIETEGYGTGPSRCD
ncbi:MAG: DUF2845 domain-containing protein [candidate division NC10 bacterium]|nr:DUF2845 domain-containing protein [candidate division NC10 bacterium]